MALRQINMIPTSILARTQLARHLGFWGKGLVFILLLLVMAYLVQINRFSIQQKTHHSDASMNITVAKKIEQARKEANNINALMQDLALKSGVLATLTNQQFYYDILAVFAQSFNDDTWIDRLSIQRETDSAMDRSTLLMDGFSLTHHTLGAFLESLSRNKRIQDVVLVSAKKQEQASSVSEISTAIRFKLTCAIIKGSLK